MGRPVIVSGLGVVSAFGTSHEAFRDGLLEGRSGIAPLASFDTSECRTTLAASLVGFRSPEWVAPMKLRRLDQTGVYALAATKLAFEDARRSIRDGGDDSVGVVLGTSTAGGQSTQVFLDALFRGGPTSAPALLFDSTVGNAAASVAALDFKLRGPNVTLSHKEASGLSAIVMAVDLLREGRASGLIAGGVEAIYETVFKAHDRFKVMSPDRVFSRRLSPFDVERSGWVMGEGGFSLWLELGDGSTPGRHGEILGVAAAGAAVPLNTWPNDPEPLARTMRQAIDDAGLARVGRQCRLRLGERERRARRDGGERDHACLRRLGPRRDVNQGCHWRIRCVGKRGMRGGLPLWRHERDAADRGTV